MEYLIFIELTMNNEQIGSWFTGILVRIDKSIRKKIMYKCFLDMDGVLVDFDSIAMKYFNTTEDELKRCGWNPGGGWWNQYCDVTYEHLSELEEDFWATLPKTQWCDQVIEIIENKFGPQNICILSTPVPNRGCLSGKYLWIENWYPKYLKQMLIGRPKYFCSGSYKVLIDDDDENIQEFESEGGRGILFPRYCNNLHAKADNPIEYLKVELQKL
jgi:5'(3')-deoxyribonucleotidase